MKTSFSRSYVSFGADTSATGSLVAATRPEYTLLLAPLPRSWTSGSSPREASACAGGAMHMLPEWTGPDGRGWDASLQKKNLRTKLPRTTLGTGLGTGLARTGTNTGTPQKKNIDSKKRSFKNKNRKEQGKETDRGAGGKEFYDKTPSHDTRHGTGAHWHYRNTCKQRILDSTAFKNKKLS